MHRPIILCWSAFLTTEQEENLIWVLERLKDVFDPFQLPTIFITYRELALICTWHINKNVMSNCKKHFETNESWFIFERDWTKIVYSTQENE